MDYLKIPGEIVESSGLSVHAKLLYGLMLNRTGLSRDNGWQDDRGVYIFFSVDEAGRVLRCGRSKAMSTIRELVTAGLIQRRRQVNQPNKIYVRDSAETDDNSRKADLRTSENQTYGGMKSELTDVRNSDSNKKEKKKKQKGVIKRVKRHQSSIDDLKVRKLVEDNIAYESLVQKVQDKSCLDGLVRLMTDVLCSNGDEIMVGGQKYRLVTVQRRLLEINTFHVEYVIECLNKNTTRVRNMRAYLLAALFNAPVTMENYYRAEALRDGLITCDEADVYSEDAADLTIWELADRGED